MAHEEEAESDARVRKGEIFILLGVKLGLQALARTYASLDYNNPTWEKHNK